MPNVRKPTTLLAGLVDNILLMLSGTDTDYPECTNGLERLFACTAVGFDMEPSITHDSLNVFRVGFDGSYKQRVVLVERSDMIDKAGSYSVGFYTVAPQSPSRWADQTALLSFISPQCPAIRLTPGRHRIVAEWVQVYEPAGVEQTAEGLYADQHTELSQVAVTKWLSMSLDQVASLAGEHPAPPGVFAKYRDLIQSNPALAHLSMVNFKAFREWALERKVYPRKTPLEWVSRGPLFADWYSHVILPLLPQV